MEKKMRVGIFVVSMIVIISFIAANEFFVIFPSYDGEVSFSVWENYKTRSEPEIMLSVETEKRYECSNYHFHHNIFMDGNSIVVSLSRHVLPPSICANAEGPGTFTEVLDLSDGEYNLELHSAKRTDIYQVIISGETISIINQTTHFSKPKKTVMERSSS
jgi:hypothetical protein